MKDLYMFVIFDKITGKYSLPIFQANEILAKRYFNQVINQKENLSEPTDYEMYQLGTYNQDTGKFDLLENMEFIEKGVANE